MSMITPGPYSHRVGMGQNRVTVAPYPMPVMTPSRISGEMHRHHQIHMWELSSWFMESPVFTTPKSS